MGRRKTLLAPIISKNSVSVVFQYGVIVIYRQRSTVIIFLVRFLLVFCPNYIQEIGLWFLAANTPHFWKKILFGNLFAKNLAGQSNPELGVSGGREQRHLRARLAKYLRSPVHRGLVFSGVQFEYPQQSPGF
jgi:hypothetical protein